MSSRTGFLSLSAALIVFGSTLAMAQSTWNLKFTSPPPNTSLQSMGYDQVHNQVVLLDAKGNTWTWPGAGAQSEWTEMYPTASPAARTAGSMAWDGVNNKLLLFGGNNGGGTNDTWEWNGTTWTLMAPANSPLPRYGAGMAWDPVHNKVILFGGHTGATPDIIYNDVWAWNGTNWTQLVANGTAGSPVPRYNFAMVFDGSGPSCGSCRNNIVMFGGNPGGTNSPGPPIVIGTILNDTWIFDGVSKWTELNTPVLNDGSWTTSLPIPTGRSGTQMVYDPVHNQVVLFGGVSANNNPATFNTNVPPGLGTTSDTDTWTWNGTVWTWLGGNNGVSACSGSSCTVTTGPDSRQTFEMVFDGTGPSCATCRNQVVVYGGNGGAQLDDIWTWDGISAAWNNPQPFNARYWSALAFDGKNNQLLMLGGWNSSRFYNDFLTWNETTSTWAPMTVAGTTTPGNRAGISMAYDSTYGTIVTWGGFTGTGTGSTASNLFTWNGASGTQTWTSKGPGLKPNAKAGYAWANFPTAGVPGTVLFGGADIPGASNPYNVWGDTYIWQPSSSGQSTNNNFVKVTPATPSATNTPSPRTGTAMAFDPVHNQLVLFGGTCPTTAAGTGVNAAVTGTCPTSGNDYNDTWVGSYTWTTGTKNTPTFTWTKLSPANSPSARAFHSMAWDPTANGGVGAVVMTGGETGADQMGGSITAGASTYYNDLWWWNGTNWIQQPSPATGPLPRYAMAMAFDSNASAGTSGKGQMALFAGDYNTVSGTSVTHYSNTDTYVWDVPPSTKGTLAAYSSPAGVASSTNFTIYGPCAITAPLPCTTNPNTVGATSYSSSSAGIGYYSVVYGAVPGYGTPATQTLLLSGGGTTAFYSDYQQGYGSFTINTQDTSANWIPNVNVTVTGPNGYNQTITTGTTAPTAAQLTGLAWGTYTVTFSSVTGYTTPTAQNITVNASNVGGTTTGLIVNGVYSVPVANAGTIIVVTQDQSGNPVNATYSVAGPNGFTSPGPSPIGNAAPGSYTITFNSLKSYVTPVQQTQTLAANGTITFTGVYQQVTGGITVNVTPASATFSIAGATSGYTSGALTGPSATVSNLVWDTYTITFNAVTGYTTPQNQVVTISASNVPGPVVVNATYQQQAGTGSITVNTQDPSGTGLAAPFTITGPNSFTFNGTGPSATASSLAAGTYTVTFNALSGYATPTAQQVTVTTTGQTVTGVYQPQTGTINVTTNIAAATFTITGPANYSGSGQSFTKTGAPAGSYTISFGAVSGYATPLNQTQTLTVGGTISFSATYQAVVAVSISLSPTSAGPQLPGTTVQFTATVQNATNTNVTWSVSAGTCTGSPGTVSAAGLFTASSTIATACTATVTATSVQDSTKSASATVSLAPVPANYADNSQFVKRMYLGFLGRAADTAGLNYWAGILNSGSASRNQVALSFFSSAEFQQFGAEVADAYIGILGRDPDHGGFTSWMTAYQAGALGGCAVGSTGLTPLLCAQQNLLQTFMTSPEYLQTYGNLNNSQFVTVVYQNTLGRSPDTAGLNYWTGELDAGVSRVTLLQDFINGAEFTALVNNRLLADMAYLGFLLRTPDAQGRVYWTNQVNSGLSPLTLVNSFITSPEFIALFSTTL